MLKERDIKDFICMHHGLDCSYQFRSKEDRMEVELLMHFAQYVNLAEKKVL